MDEDLIRRVNLKKNGANAHDVNSTINEYRAQYSQMMKHPDKPYTKAKFTSLLFILNEFADTGDIKAAIKNNPTHKFIKKTEENNVAD